MKQQLNIYFVDDIQIRLDVEKSVAQELKDEILKNGFSNMKPFYYEEYKMIINWEKVKYINLEQGYTFYLF